MGQVSDLECYQIYMQTEPIPFGRFSKRHYYLYVDNNLRYGFTSTARPHDECHEICMRLGDVLSEKMLHSFKVFIKENGTTRLIFKRFRSKTSNNEKQVILPEDYLEIRTEKKDYKTQIRVKKWKDKKFNKKNGGMEITDKKD